MCLTNMEGLIADNTIALHTLELLYNALIALLIAITGLWAYVSIKM